jgi:hypothetical protein
MTRSTTCKRYVVGRIDKASRRRWFTTLKQAEAYIARIEQRDPASVHRGDYYIDGPCR